MQLPPRPQPETEGGEVQASQSVGQAGSQGEGNGISGVFLPLQLTAQHRPVPHTGG
jgi:hypothetical protein